MLKIRIFISLTLWPAHGWHHTPHVIRPRWAHDFIVQTWRCRWQWWTHRRHARVILLPAMGWRWRWTIRRRWHDVRAMRWRWWWTIRRHARDIGNQSNDDNEKDFHHCGDVAFVRPWKKVKTEGFCSPFCRFSSRTFFWSASVTTTVRCSKLRWLRDKFHRPKSIIILEIYENNKAIYDEIEKSSKK